MLDLCQWRSSGRHSLNGGGNLVREVSHYHPVLKSNNPCMSSGDIIHLFVLGRSYLVLNSEESARELLEKRSRNNSDRPRFILMQELSVITLYCLYVADNCGNRMGWGNMLVFLPYGETFKLQRKLLQQYWSAQGIIQARPIQRAETHKLLMKLLQTSENYEKDIERHVGFCIEKNSLIFSL